MVFNRVYRLEIQSVMLVFSTPLGNYRSAHLSLSLVHLPPLPVSISTGVHVFIQCVTGGKGGLGPQTDKHLPPSTYIFKKSRHLRFGLYRYLVHANNIHGSQLSVGPPLRRTYAAPAVCCGGGGDATPPSPVWIWGGENLL
jgi:hypothetical protein